MLHAGPVRAALLPAALCATAALALAAGFRASSAQALAIQSAIADAESITLPSGAEQYLYVGSTAGGPEMEAVTWSPDLAVSAAYSGHEAVSIGRSSSDAGSYSALTGNHAIAAAALSGYTIKEAFHASTSAVGPGSSGGPETPAPGVNLELTFATEARDVVLIVVGGQGAGALALDGIAATTLQSATYSGGSDVLASGAIYEAALATGIYTARFTSTTYLTNSGTSLGAVAYVLEPRLGREVTSTSSGGGGPSSSGPSGGERQSTHPRTAHPLAPVASFAPLFATRADLSGRTLGLLTAIPTIRGLGDGATVTIRCRRRCPYRLKMMRHVGGRRAGGIRFRRPFVLRNATVVEIVVTQPGRVGRFADYRFRHTREGVLAYETAHGCIGERGRHVACT